MRVLVCIPIKPTLHPSLREKCANAAMRMPPANPDLTLGFYFDCRKIPAQDGDSRPWSRVTRARNAMLANIDRSAWDFLLWIDADVVDYPPELPTRLLAGNPSGVSSPFVKIEGTSTFYDFAAFIQKDKSHIEPENRWLVKGRNVDHYTPYFDEPREGIVEMDCVGTVTMVPIRIYDRAHYMDHPAFTDHFPICQAARELGLRVTTDLNTVAWHADLPIYGEEWH